MARRLSCSQGKSMRATKRTTNTRALVICFWIAACTMTLVPRAAASGDAPQWMHALAGVPVPVHDEKTDAVLLYSETNVTVVSQDRIKKHVREVYKILRPEGRER